MPKKNQNIQIGVYIYMTNDICQIESQIECEITCQIKCQIYRVSEKMPDQMSERMPHQLSDRMQNEMPELSE
jgi:hypothetical protein